jgi:hypothetical protein
MPFSLIWLLSALLILFNSIGLSGEIINRQLDKSILNNFPGENENSICYQAALPTNTVIINLPIIENNAPISTPLSPESYPAPESSPENPPGTPTPTPIPVQTGSANVPIVLGALAIISVILLAWFFLGYLPSRIKDKPS